MSRLDVVVDGDLAIGDGTPPDLMVATTHLDKFTLVSTKYLLQLGRKAGHCVEPGNQMAQWRDLAATGKACWQLRQVRKQRFTA
jgi:hypothetical protein